MLSIVHSTLNKNNRAKKIVETFTARVRADGGIVESTGCTISQITRLGAFYNKASLILTPTGYKESKLYSILPTGGTGDFAFTRSLATATRNAASFIEAVPYNLFDRSNEFDNATWTKSSASVTTNAAIAPDGSTTADKIVLNAGVSGYVAKLLTPDTASSYRISVYAKAGEFGWLSLRFGTITYFNLNTGAIGTVGVGHTPTIESVGNGWYRCTVTANGSNTIRFYPTNSDNSLDAGTSVGIFLWGAQLVVASSSPTLFGTTDRLNVPRLDYGNLTCPSILMEPQRTNLVIRSAEIDNASWTKINLTVVPNAAVSPEGLLTADSLIETAVTSLHRFYQGVSKAATNITYSFSIYVKPNGRDWIHLNVNNGVNSVGRYFNISTGIMGSASSTGAGFSLVNSVITPSQNGWYRCEIIAISDTTTQIFPIVEIASADLTASYLGDITKGVYAWGAQLEASAYATSYIPTTTAIVTRNADVFAPLTGITSLIGQTEGTLYAGVKTTADSTEKDIAISDGTTNNRVLIRFSSSNTIDGLVVVGASVQASIVSATFTSNTEYRIALVYRSNYAALFINGVKIGQDLTVTVPACNQFLFNRGDNLSTFRFIGQVGGVAISKTAITDAEAIAITTL